MPEKKSQIFEKKKSHKSGFCSFKEQIICLSFPYIKNGSKIEVIAEKGTMVILPQKKTLDDMLAMVTSENIHSEISTGSSAGNEEW